MRGGLGLGCLWGGWLLASWGSRSSRSWGRQALLLPRHTSSLHAGHPPAEHLSLLEPVLQLLLPELLLDVEAEWHWALVLLAVLGVIAAKGNKLFANGASTIGFPFAAFGVLYNPLHLLAGRQGTVGIAALAGMHQRLDAALDAQAARVSWALCSCSLLVIALIIQAET